MEQSDPSPHCLPVCKNRFEKFARIFSRRHKQTTFSDAGFLGILRVNLTLKYSSGRAGVVCTPMHTSVSMTTWALSSGSMFQILGSVEDN